MGPGSKLKDAQLMGYPAVVLIGQHTQHDDDLVEVEGRITGMSETMTFDELCERMAGQKEMLGL